MALETMIDGQINNKYDFTVTVEAPEITDEFATPEVSERVEHDMRVAAEINREEIRKGNPITEDHNPGLDYVLSVAPQIAEWRELIAISPSLALEPFYHPGDHLLRPAVMVEKSAHEWLTDQQLGVALRNRMKLKKQLLVEKFSEIALSGEGVRQPEALILASGRGRTPIMAAIEAGRKTGITPNLTAVDIDRNALEYSEIIARDSGFNNLTLIDRDIMQVSGFENESIIAVLKRSFLKGQMARICTRSLAPDSFDVTTAIGIKMYIPDEKWKYPYDKEILGRHIAGEVDKIGASELIQNMYYFTRQGGWLLYDAINHNKSLGRYEINPQTTAEKDAERFLQLEITDMMGWSRLRTSTELDNLNLIQKSGIKTDEVKIVRDPSGFFSFYLVHKP